MNSSLGQDYDEFRFQKEVKLEAANVEEDFHNLRDLLRCELCDQRFDTKKDLQSHLLAHIGQPRVVLKRIPNTKTSKKEASEKFWPEVEPRGTLKITLKLKKSPMSESFTVVRNNLEAEKNSCDQEYELATKLKDDHQSDSEEEEKTSEQSYENVILNQENDYENDEDDEEENLESEPDHNPLESSERPIMDNNEADSGVGSDTANLLEKEDQNVDDLQGDNNSNSDQNELADNEDQENEESDALEATCRETIENLKKLGELESRYVYSRSSEILDPRADSVENEEEEVVDEEENEAEEDEEEEERRPRNLIEDRFQSNSEISLVPRSALMAEKPSSTTHEKETEILPIGGGSSISWTKIVNENSNSNKSREDSRHSMDKDEVENSESAGSILQNFLLEQQRGQNESRDIPLETEYVSLEKLAESVNTCKVCNEKFKDISHLDAHKSKVGHYQCSSRDCSSLVFKTPMEVSVHKSQDHGAPVSPSVASSSVASVSPHNLSQTHSPHSQSPHLSQTHSPLMNAHSPHSPSVQVPQHPSRSSPITSPHANSPTIPTISQQHTYPPVNMEQLPVPVQQLAQQVQRMPLPPQPVQMSPGGPSMIPHGATYYPGPPGRPPMYGRVQGPPIAYPPNLAMYAAQQYAAAAAAGNSYHQQMGLQAQMQSQMAQQQMPRGRYPAMVPGQRHQRLSQPPPPGSLVPMQRVRMKRPTTQISGHQMQQQQQVHHQQQQAPPSAVKQRRMDVLLPDRNEDADCHVIAQQKRNDGLPVIQNVQGGASVQQQQNPSNNSGSGNSRSDSMIHLTDAITLSVRQPAQINANVQSKKPDASSVANVLAARGITVTPASNKKNAEQSNSQSQQQSSQQQQQQTPPKQPSVVSTLNLNSAISIIPASSQRKQQLQQQEQSGQFAVPQNKQSKQVNSEVERPPRPPTVDLTQDNAPLQPVRRGRPPRMLQSLTCQICDKRFQSQEVLNNHMTTHRTANKLPHKCNLCPAQYPSTVALAMHKKTYHKEVDAMQNSNIELAIPVVDLKSPASLTRLKNLGIQSYIPLSQLSAMTGGNYGLPIVTIDGARNPNSNNLAALGATSILSLGTLKHLSHR
ncbi:myosin tail region-interacting protein MTI1-like isoform X2 [Copidosoma floridanum]|uniref:myosin tail region-interacting protein MTI1-like isoform X2 n=1 Tax=Copidosoma floridanum TaxID=29053 RepID=UPI0006C9D987|nr:myosin tail region-interacting protein MTI1-like isoform X2 [Copidosoma floridanum]